MSEHQDRFRTIIEIDTSRLPKLMSDLECCGNCGNYMLCPDYKKPNNSCKNWVWDMLKKGDRE